MIYKSKKNLLKSSILILLVISSYFVYTKIIYDLLPYNEYISNKERKDLKIVLNNNLTYTNLISKVALNNEDLSNHRKNINEYLVSLESYKKDISFCNIDIRDKINFKNNDLNILFKEYDTNLVLAWNKNRERITYFFEYYNSLKNPYNNVLDNNQKINNVENSITESNSFNFVLFRNIDSLLKKANFKMDLVNGAKIIEVD